jgi:hypothetical protein
MFIGYGVIPTTVRDYDYLARSIHGRTFEAGEGLRDRGDREGI